jgi:hypothetical protein
MIINFNRKKEYRIQRRGLIMEDYTPRSKKVDLPTIEDDNTPIKKDKSRKRYDELVRKLTYKVNKSDIEGYDPDKVITRDMVLSEGRGIFYHSDLLVIDHKISISYGYKNNISPEDIAHVSNLRYIPSNLNWGKGADNHIDNYNSWLLK